MTHKPADDLIIERAVSDFWFTVHLDKADIVISPTRLQFTVDIGTSKGLLDRCTYDSSGSATNYLHAPDDIRAAFDRAIAVFQRLKNRQLRFSYHAPFDVTQKGTDVPKKANSTYGDPVGKVLGIDQWSYRYLITELLSSRNQVVAPGSSICVHPIAYLDWGNDFHERAFSDPESFQYLSVWTVDNLLKQSISLHIEAKEEVQGRLNNGSEYGAKAEIKGSATIHPQSGLAQQRDTEIQLYYVFDHPANSTWQGGLEIIKQTWQSKQL
ncbi:MAG: hypothetical protein KDK65_00880 [Chlamydiia bacterium]|nr:hypothetical protein [Chlamydiia bacterium]